MKEEEERLKRNITLSIKQELLRKAKLVAEKNTSISRLLAEQISRIIEEEDQYETPRRRAVAPLKKGFHLGGSILTTRKEIHDRR